MPIKRRYVESRIEKKAPTSKSPNSFIEGILKNENELRMNLKRDANMRETIFLRVDANRQSMYVDDSFNQR